jgi:hypothetical protein
MPFSKILPLSLAVEVAWPSLAFTGQRTPILFFPPYPLLLNQMLIAQISSYQFPTINEFPIPYPCLRYFLFVFVPRVSSPPGVSPFSPLELVPSTRSFPPVMST